MDTKRPISTKNSVSAALVGVLSASALFVGWFSASQLGEAAADRKLRPVARALVSNGSFEHGLRTWAGHRARLKVVRGGVAGRQAVRVSAPARGSSFSIYHWPVVATHANHLYTARAAVRGGTRPGRVCLLVREYARSKAVGSARECLTVGGAWNNVVVRYVASATGNRLAVSLYASGLDETRSFFADAIRLRETTTASRDVARNCRPRKKCPSSETAPSVTAPTTTTTTTSTTTPPASGTTTTAGPSTATLFETLPPGSTLRSGSECAGLVRRSVWEPRPMNATSNATRGAKLPQPTGWYHPSEWALTSRVDGNFTGTTDEIIQWAACKWGFSENLVRAIAVTESWWNHRDTKGDAGHSVGLLQIKCAYEGDPHRRAWPHCLDSTAFNVDYGLSYIRNAFEGNFSYWWPSDPAWQAVKGDIWLAVGAYYWPGNRQAMLDYAAKVRGHVEKAPWRSDPSFYNYYTQAGAWSL